MDATPHAAPDLAESTTRVLLVVDQPRLANLIALTLHHCRATTRVAPDAEEALVALREWRPRLAIVDMDLVDDAFLDELAGLEGPRGFR